MTHEEAIKRIETHIEYHKSGAWPFTKTDEALYMAIAALREQSNATQRVANTDNALDDSNCAGCRWWGVRPQRCSCCRRNIYMKDGYEPQEDL